jgi:aldehyde dehydrogenase (NAD+)
MTNEIWHEECMLVDGSLVGAADGALYDNVNPATEDVMGQAVDAGLIDVDRAIQAARRAFDETGWSTDVTFRVRCLRQLRDALVAHGEDLRSMIVAEGGTPVSLTYGAQLDDPVATLGWIADLAERYEYETDLGRAAPYGMPALRRVVREPVGVVGAITPWNFPTQINLAKVGPALGAGNTVVLKPAPDTPWSGTALGRLVAEETDIPPGVFNVVTSAGHVVGQRLAQDPRVDMVSFTGSTANGRSVMEAAAGNLKRVFLELGGKSAAVVLLDADIKQAVAMTAIQILTHAGQGCAITTRLLLPRSRYDEGVGEVVDVLSGLSYGDPTDPAHLMGPLISRRQRQRVLGYIERGCADGATVALGGGIPEHLPHGFYVEPTVLVDVDSDAVVAQEEIFGPVLVVLSYDDTDDDAVRVANNSVYGLSGAVFSGSVDHARAVALRIRTGTVSVNGAVWYSADVPFGGYKQSGFGREMGIGGFEEYLEIKSIAEPA